MAELRRGKRMHAWAFPVGAIFIALAVVGAVSLGAMLIEKGRQWAQNPEEIQRYEAFLRPIVEHDPDPFETVAKANTAQLLDISIWSLLHNAPDVEKYRATEEADDGAIHIPQADVEAEYRRLFDAETARHATIEGADYTFEYEETTKTYRIPQTGTLAIYVPQVVEYNKEGQFITLLVNYLSYGTVDWADAADGVPVRPAPTKMLEIKLRTAEDGRLTLSSIQVPEGQQAAALEALGSTRLTVPSIETTQASAAAVTARSAA
ncbi:MAG: hypothetical protein LBC83_08215 [Oscillospiraceae bacterium]|nr:hypothetical protein [Oscillospiraceae bacterium]